MNQKQIVDLFKRFLIVFLVICIPLVVILTLAAKLSSVLVIIISVMVTAGIFALEEFLYYKMLKKRQERREKYKRENKNK